MNVDQLKPEKGLGIFVAGYRWSGSGAVSDWLGGHSALCRVRDSEAAFGEIRALNYGLRFLLLTAAGRIPYGEKLGRWALCPDPRWWSEVLGPPISRERGRLAFFYLLLDWLYFSAARLKVIPSVRKYKQLLDSQLGQDFRHDEEYQETVRQLVAVLRSFARRSRSSGRQEKPENDNSLRLAFSQIIDLFARRIGTDGQFLVFDNAISGLHPEFFHLLHPNVFPGQIILFVRRDPRDQFAELVKYSGSTFPWSVGSFIRQYRQAQEKTQRFIDEAAAQNAEGAGRRFIRRISFETFVLNKNGVREQLQQDLQNFGSPTACLLNHSGSRQRPARKLTMGRTACSILKTQKRISESGVLRIYPGKCYG